MAELPTQYPPLLAVAIFDAVAEGQNLTTICAAPGMPSRSTVHRWLREDDELARRYALAVELRAQHRADQLAELNEKVLAGKVPPQEAKVVADNLKWLMSREDPKRFGERLTQELRGADGKDLLPERRMSDVEVVRWMAFKFAKAEMALKQEEASALALGLRDG